MHEIVISRHNEIVDPLLRVWEWQIPIYLFLGGLVAGMMIISGYFLFTDRQKDPTSLSNYLSVISLVLISLGMLALFLDLEHKLYVWRLYLTFKIKSPMSWGAWILILVYPALFANMIIRAPEKLVKWIPKIQAISDNLSKHLFGIKLIGILNMIIGGILGIYTGILLSTLAARPLWNSSMLWMLFLISGLSSAAAFTHLVAKNKDERELLAKADNGFLIVELFIIALFFIGFLTATDVHIRAINLLIDGPYAATFWVFVCLIGIIIPLILQFLAVNHKICHTAIPPLMVIMGGIILRFIIVYAGQYSHWLR